LGCAGTKSDYLKKITVIANFKNKPKYLKRAFTFPKIENLKEKTIIKHIRG